MTDRTGLSAGEQYLLAGWCPITLPKGRKYPPPDGRTGANGIDMSADEVQRTDWSNTNVGIRMPDGVIGLDVDAYDGKVGLETLRRLIAELGPLPFTVASHSGRGDGSAIYYFAAPVGMRWVSALPGIEVIQRNHRYGAVYPSVHPDGRVYGWIDVPARTTIEGVPQVDDLAELPWPWVEYLARPEGVETSARVASTEQVQAFVEAHADVDGAPGYLGVITDHFRAKVAEGHSRHDTMTHCLIWAMECVRAGAFSAERASLDLHLAWQSAMARPGGRRESHSEWRMMVAHGVGKALAKPQASIDSIHDDLMGMPIGPPLAAEQQQLPGMESSWRPIDLRPVVAEHYEQPRPSVLMRSDLDTDGYLFYAASINGIHGDSGTGKGWIACSAIKAEIVNRRTVILVDLEDTPGSIVARLRLLGVTDQAMLDYLIYIRPVEPPVLDDIGHLCSIIAERGVTLCVVDSLGEAFSLDGVNEDKDVEVAPWWRRNLRPLADAGAAVLVVDHATKASDNPLHPSGSKRKRAAITGASYLIVAVVPLVKGDGGVIDLVCAKDRHGNYRRGDVVSRMMMHPDGLGIRVRFDVPAGPPSAADVSLGVLKAAELAVETCRDLGPFTSQNALIAAMGSGIGTDMKRAGIDYAASREAIERAPGVRGALVHSYARDLDE